MAPTSREINVVAHIRRLPDMSERLLRQATAFDTFGAIDHWSTMIIGG
jgi:hypothetical protein